MTKVAIIYASRHGATEKVSRTIAGLLKGCEVDVWNVKSAPVKPALSEYDIIVLGTPIYEGMPLRSIKHFCTTNTDILLSKKLRLFVCGMQTSKNQLKDELASAYPQVLQQHAGTVDFFGGEFQWEKMNFLERFIVEKVSKVNSSVSAISEKRIQRFIDTLNTMV